MIKYISIIFLIALLWSCDKESLEGGESKSLVLKQAVEINVGECASDNGILELCVDSVSSDSRCPSDAICVWEGNAEVNVQFSINGTSHNLVLNTNNSKSFPSDTTINQYHISLTQLKPDPISTTTINQEDYVATLIVKELED